MSMETDKRFGSLRERAEALLNRIEEDPFDFSPHEIGRIIHDLSVHQIELELQNEELRNIQNQLEDARDRYARLYHQAPVGYLSLDHHGIIRQFNQTFADLLGWAASDLNGHALADFMTDSDREVFFSRFRVFFSQPSGKSIDTILHGRDGRSFCVRLTGRQDPDAPPLSSSQPRLLVVVHDISAQKALEDALRESRAFQELLLETLPTPVYYKDVEGRYLGCNKAFAELVGLSKEAIIGKTAYQIALKGLADIDQIQDCDLLQGASKTHVYQSVVTDAEGRQHEVLSYKACIIGSDGVLRGLIGVILDVSAQKKTEMLFHDTLQALRESEQSLKFVLDGSRLGTWDWNIKTGVVRHNDCWAEMLGYAPSEMDDATTSRWLEHIHPDDREQFWQSIEDNLAGQTPLHELEYRIKARDGNYRWIFDRARVVNRDQQGRATRMSGTHEDITERKRTENALRENQIFLKGILDSVSSHIAVIDHSGVIVAVNEAWRRFALENSPEPDRPAPRTDVGVNYLEACSSSATTHTETSDETPVIAYDGIQAVLDGRLPTFSLEYPCHSPDEQRWFLMTVTPLGDARRSAVVVHTNITDRKQAEEQIRNFAYYDSLTQLPNRRLLQDRLALSLVTSQRTGQHGMLMLIDLDNFKPINDQQGHAVGDLLLIEVARRLTGSVRQMDTVARLGGDEFVVLVGGLDADGAVAREQAFAIAEKIRRALAKPYQLSIHPEGEEPASIQHHCSSSIGVAMFLGQEIREHELLKQADAAMYQAKASGRNAIHLFEATP